MSFSTNQDTDDSKAAAAEEVMNDDSIWSTPAVFELLQFPTDGATMESRNSFLELEAAEIVPAGEKSTHSTACVSTDPELGFSLSSAAGRSLLDDAEAEAIPKGRNTKPIDRLISDWGEDTADLLDCSGGFAQVFSSEFESEVATLVSNHEEESDSFKRNTDDLAPQAVPCGIAFMYATSSIFLPGDMMKPTNYRPESRVKTLEGPENTMGQRSLFELAFKDRIDALEAAKKCLVALEL